MTTGVNLLSDASFEDGRWSQMYPGEAYNVWELKGGVRVYSLGSQSRNSSASHGQKFIDVLTDPHGFGNASIGSVAQTVRTTPGQQYQLTFDMAGDPACGSPEKFMRVDIDQQHKVFRYDTTGQNPHVTNWTTHTMTYTATRSTLTVRFTAIVDNTVRAEPCGAWVDNTSLIAIGAGGVQGGGGVVAGGGPWAGSAGGGTNTAGGGPWPGTGGSGGSTSTPSHPASGGSVLTSNMWQASQTGQGKCSQSGDQLCIDSMGPGGAYLTSPRRYSVQQDYTVSFEAQLTQENNHWVVLYSDGFVFLNMDWGMNFTHAQGQGVKSAGQLAPNRWYSIRADAHPSQGTFDVYVDGVKVSTAQSIKYPQIHHNLSASGSLPADTILIGDIDDLSYRGGAYNRGGVCWRNIHVSSGGGAPVSGSVLTPNVWQPNKNGGGTCSQSGGELCIDSMQPGGAYFTTRRQYSVDQNYTVSFDVRLTQKDNHVPILYSDGFVFVNIDWGTDLCHAQPGNPYGLKAGLGKLDVGRWYSIRVDAFPGRHSFDLYLEGRKVSTATNINFPHPYHLKNSTVSISPDLIHMGDPDDLSAQGGAYNRGGVCWRNIRVSASAGAPVVYRDAGENVSAAQVPVLPPAAAQGDSLPGTRLSSDFNNPAAYDQQVEGMFEFRGRVDGLAILHIRGDQVYAESVGGRPVTVENFRFTQPLPASRLASLVAEKKDGRGEIELWERPSADNGYSASIRINDPKGGDDRYHLRLHWKR